MNFKIKRLVSLLLPLVIAACSTVEEQSELSGVLPLASDRQYNKLIESSTQKEEKYDGFYNLYQVSATMHHSDVAMAILGREGHFLNWSLAKAQTEREKLIQEMSSQAEFFVSFFAPSKAHDDMHKANTMWKAYLQFNGNKYEGKIKKIKSKYITLKTIYPFHSNFSSPYKVVFEVPMTGVEQYDATFILTSSLGTTRMVFPKKN